MKKEKTKNTKSKRRSTVIIPDSIPKKQSLRKNLLPNFYVPVLLIKEIYSILKQEALAGNIIIYQKKKLHKKNEHKLNPLSKEELVNDTHKQRKFWPLILQATAIAIHLTRYSNFLKPIKTVKDIEQLRFCFAYENKYLPTNPIEDKIKQDWSHLPKQTDSNRWSVSFDGFKFSKDNEFKIAYDDKVCHEDTLYKYLYLCGIVKKTDNPMLYGILKNSLDVYISKSLNEDEMLSIIAYIQNPKIYQSVWLYLQKTNKLLLEAEVLNKEKIHNERRKLNNKIKERYFLDMTFYQSFSCAYQKLMNGDVKLAKVLWVKKFQDYGISQVQYLLLITYWHNNNILHWTWETVEFLLDTLMLSWPKRYNFFYDLDEIRAKIAIRM